MAIDLNRSPYFDDTESQDNFSRVLFVPGRGVQARELTSMQTIQQSQVAEIASLLLNDGDVITPGALSFSLSSNYVRISSFGAMEISESIGKTFIGATSGVRAKIIHADKSTNGSVIFVSYISGGDKVELGRSGSVGTISIGDTLVGQTGGASITVLSVTSSKIIGRFTNSLDFSIGENVISETASFTVSSILDYSFLSTFYPGETINEYELIDGDVSLTGNYSLTVNAQEEIIDGTTIQPVGKGSLATISEGTYFIRGLVTKVFDQIAIISAYSTKPSAQVGLFVRETIVTSDDDPNLLDNASGSRNENAPGADRLKIDLILGTISLTDESTTSSFIPLLKLNEGVIEQRKNAKGTKPTLIETLAERTYDESGNYTVRPFGVRIREHNKKEVDATGVSGIYGESGDSTKLVASLSSGKAYVSGFPVEIPEVQNVPFERARTTQTDSNIRIDAVNGAYVLATNLNTLPFINLKDGVSQQFLTVNLFNIDYPCVVGIDAEVNNISGTSITLPIGFPESITDLFKGGTILVDTGSLLEARGIISSNATTIIVDSAFVSTDFTNAKIKILGPSPTVFSENLGEQYASKIIGTARIKDVVLEKGDQGPTGIYRIYLFDVVMNSGYSLNDVRSIGTRTESLGGGALNKNFPRDFRANLLAELTLRNFSGITFSKVNRDGKIAENAKNPYTRIRAIRSDGSSDLMFALVHNWNESAKKLLIQNISGVYESDNKFENIIGADDSIQEIDEFNQPTGASAEIIKSINIFDSKVNGFFIKLSNNYVNDVDGVQLYGIRRTGTSLISDSVVEFSPKTNENISSASGGIQQTNVLTAFVGSGKNIIGCQSVSATIEDELLTISDYSGISSSEKITALYTVDKTNPVLKKKILSGIKTEYILNREFAQQKIVQLQNADIYELIGVWESMDANNTFGITEDAFNDSWVQEITSRYVLDNGQRDDFYERGSIVLKSGENSPTRPIKIQYRYFEHTDGDYFSIKSYPTQQIGYKNIGTFTSSLTGEIYRLSDILDFRPRKDKFGNFNPKLGAITSEILTTNSWVEISSVAFYLPRIDKLVVNKDGVFSVLQGTPSLNPSEPSDPQDSMVLYILSLNPYTITTNDVFLKYVDNRRYTMQDIGKLDKRLTAVENGIVLSSLESSALNLRLTTTSGNERSKTAVIVDSFDTHLTGDVDNPDYRAAIDPVEGELRPETIVKSVRFDLNDANNAGVSQNGEIITLPYVDEESTSFKSKSTSLKANPFPTHVVYGSLKLSPWADIGFSEDYAPNVVENKSKSSVANGATVKENLFGTIFDSWRIFGDGISQDEEKTGTTFGESQGGRYTDLSISYPMQNMTIRFTGEGLKPNTRYYPFFANQSVGNFTWIDGETPVFKEFVDIDFTNILFLPTKTEEPKTENFVIGEQVTQYNTNGIELATGNIFSFDNGTKVLTLNNISGSFVSNTGTISLSATTPLQPMGVVRRYVGGGTPLYTDANGSITGLFVYRTNLNTEISPIYSGEQVFRLTTSKTDDDSADSMSEGTFVAWISPQIRNNNIITTRPTETSLDGISKEYGTFKQPFAQLFSVPTTSGEFLNAIELFFKYKDDTLPISIELRNVENGELGSEIIPGTQITKPADEILVSELASISTKFIFDYPVYIQPNKDYAIVIKTESTVYEIFVGEYNKSDIESGKSIVPIKNIGALYVPTNSAQIKTFSGSLKFNAIRCLFDTTRSYVPTFKNIALSPKPFVEGGFYTIAGSSSIKVLEENHGFPENGLVSFSGLTGEFNGIPASDINGEHTISTLSGFDGFFIGVDTSADISGYAFAANVDPMIISTISSSVKADLVCLKKSTLLFQGCSLGWKLQFGSDQLIDLSENKNIVLPSTKYFGDESGVALIYARISSSNPYLSPIIDVGRLGLISIANRISDKTVQSVSNLESRVVISPPYSDSLIFSGGRSFVRTDVSIDRLITLNLSELISESNTSNFIVTDATNITDWFEVGATVITDNIDRFSSGIVNEWNATDRILKLQDVSGSFENSAIRQLATSTIPSTKTLSPPKVTSGEVIVTFDNLQANTIFTIGDIIDIETSGSISNKILKAKVIDIPSTNTINLAVSPYASVRKSTVAQSGSTTIKNISKTSSIYSSNVQSAAYLKTVVDNTYITIKSDEGVPSTNTTIDTDAFRVISTNPITGEIIVDADFVNYTANNTSNIIISTYTNMVSDLAAKGSQADCIYISKPVSLDQPSNYLRVVVDASIPRGTRLDLFYRTKQVGDSRKLEDISWTAFNATQNNLESSNPDNGALTNIQQFVEYQYSTGTIQPFTTFAVQIALRAEQTNIIPRITNLRVVAATT